jgi:hypothetical protein
MYLLPSIPLLTYFKQFEDETDIRVLPQHFVEDYDFRENMHELPM